MANYRITSGSVLLMFVCGLSVGLIGQSAPTIPDEAGYRPFRYDSAHQAIFFGNGITAKSSKPIRAFNLDGVERGSAINIFKDFPNLDHMLVDDLAAGPDGKTVIAAVLNFGSKRLKHVILTYSSSGELLELWDTEPYYVQGIATDDAGNVFALGNRLDQGVNVNPPYPLLIEYSPSGQGLHESLSSALFKNGPSAINQAQRIPDPILMLRGDHLLIYAPTEAEFLVCSTDGAIIRRFSLAGVLKDITVADHVKSVEVHNVILGDEYRLVLDLMEDVGSDKPKIPITVAVNLHDGTNETMIQSILRTWLGVGIRDNKLMVLSHDGSKDFASIKSFDLPF